MKTDAIRLRVFIEGVLVPKVTSVTVNTTAGEVSTAAISLPPVPGIESEALTRARVQIFFSDVDIRSSVNDDQWPLLFEGEVTGDGFSKTPSGRSLILRCSGYHTYWQQVLLSYYDPSTTAPGQVVNASNINMFLGNKELKLDLGVAGANLVSRLSNKFKEQGDKDYNATVVEIMSDSLDANHFFSGANSALKLAERFISPKDKAVKTLISREHVLEIVNKHVASYSGDRSMMETMKDVLSVLRYQLIANAQPRMVPVAESTEKLSAKTDPLTEFRNRAVNLAVSVGGQQAGELVKSKFSAEVSIGDLVDIAEEAASFTSAGNEAAEELYRGLVEIRNEAAAALARADKGAEAKSVSDETAIKPRLSQFIALPDTRFAGVPRCNVIFPGSQTGWSLERDFLSEPTRMFARASVSSVPNNFYVAPGNLLTARSKQGPVKIPIPRNGGGLSSPIVGPYYVTSGFGPRNHPVLKQIREHKGIDLGAPLNTEIRAVMDGRVIDSRVSQTAGEMVVINHGDGQVTKYYHMVTGSRTVSRGQDVVAGQVIGLMGKTGRVTGVHLHFEWVVSGKHEDPIQILLATGSSGAVTPGGKRRIVGREPAVQPDDKAIESGVEVSGTELGSDAEATGRVIDWKYLTPEEEIKGIVPIFGDDVAEAHKAISLSNPDGFNEYMKSIVNTEFLWRRYSTRSFPGLEMPLNVNVVAGFPGLVVDTSGRSLIAMISSVSHHIAVGGGGGSATTSVSMIAPRFWDEGDPYYWSGGASKYKDGVPDQETANFPAYYLGSLVPTNSGSGYDVDRQWPSGQSLSGNADRDIDKVYRLLLGCPSIPYEFGTRESPATGQTVAYNKAIAGESGSQDSAPRTIAGTYERLTESGGDAARYFAKEFTKREMVNERQLLTEILGSKRDGISANSYTGPAFRPSIQGLIRAMTKSAGDSRGFRG